MPGFTVLDISLSCIAYCALIHRTFRINSVSGFWKTLRCFGCSCLVLLSSSFRAPMSSNCFLSRAGQSKATFWNSFHSCTTHPTAGLRSLHWVGKLQWVIRNPDTLYRSVLFSLRVSTVWSLNGSLSILLRLFLSFQNFWCSFITHWKTHLRYDNPQSGSIIFGTAVCLYTVPSTLRWLGITQLTGTFTTRGRVFRVKSVVQGGRVSPLGNTSPALNMLVPHIFKCKLNSGSEFCKNSHVQWPLNGGSAMLKINGLKLGTKPTLEQEAINSQLTRGWHIKTSSDLNFHNFFLKFKSFISQSISRLLQNIVTIISNHIKSWNLVPDREDHVSNRIQSNLGNMQVIGWLTRLVLAV